MLLQPPSTAAAEPELMDATAQLLPVLVLLRGDIASAANTLI